MSSRTRRVTAAVAGAAAISLLAACSSSGSSSSTPAGGTSSSAGANASASATVLAGGKSCSSSATPVMFWAWVPGISRAVTQFNQTHPSICVTLEDPGAGGAEYTLLNNAMKAGSGAPDVAEVEFDELPSFIIQKYVVDLVPYGANNYKNLFATWAWSQVSQGNAVYAMPSDWGMILPSLVSPVGVYLMRTYIRLSVPRELIDAARIDGAGETRIFFKIALPLMVPGLMTVLLLSVVGVWNNYFLPLIIFSDNNKFPLTVGMGLWSQHATTSGDQNLYPLIVMGGLVTIAPLIILFLILQRYWRSGMLLGSIAN
jgi:Binding-protein-dependent transport system inner membrane component